MRVAVFDTESNFWPGRFNAYCLEDYEVIARQWRAPRFDCGVAFELPVRRWRVFCDPRRLGRFLASCDTIVSYNGIHDLGVLSRVLEADMYAQLKRIRHIDVTADQPFEKLEYRAKRQVPIAYQKQERLMALRLAALELKYPNLNGTSVPYAKGKVVKCKYDVALTLALFELQLAI